MKFLFLAFLPIALVSNAQTTPANGFNITGKIAGLAEQSLVTVTDVNNPTDTLARGSVKNGGFVLKGSMTEPNLVQLNLDAVQKKTILFIGNEKLDVTGTAENLQELSVKGSDIHADFMAFQGIFNPLFRRLSELNQQLSANPGLTREDTLVKEYTAQFSKIQGEVDKFINEKQNSPLSAFVLVVTSELEQDFTVVEKRLKKIRRGCGIPQSFREDFSRLALSNFAIS